MKIKTVACSTPFGIYEVGTARILPTQLTLASGAQRLSASMRLARQTRRVLKKVTRECSTPFGIYEVGTILSITPVKPSGLCSTPFGIYEVGTTTASRTTLTKGKVLNAFRHL